MLLLIQPMDYICLLGDNGLVDVSIVSETGFINLDGEVWRGK